MLYADAVVIDDPISALLKPAAFWRSIGDEAYHAREALLASLLAIADLRPLIVADRLCLAPYRDRHFEGRSGYSMGLVLDVLRELAADEPELAEMLDAQVIPQQQQVWTLAALEYVTAQLAERTALGLGFDFFLPFHIHRIALRRFLNDPERRSDPVRAHDGANLGDIDGLPHVAASLALVRTPRVRQGSVADFVDLVESEDYAACRAAVGRAMSRVSAEIDLADRDARRRASARLQEELVPAFQDLCRRSEEKGSFKAAAGEGMEALVFGAIPTATAAAMGAPPESVGATAGATAAAAVASFCWSIGRGRALARHGRTARDLATGLQE